MSIALNLTPFGDVFNTKKGFHQKVKICLNGCMDMQKIRRKNLTALCDSLAAGNVTAFGRKIGKSQSATSDLLSGRKSFGEKMARSIEKNLGLVPFKLDIDPDSPGITGTTDTGYAVNVEPASSTRIQYPLISWVQAGVWSEIVDAYPRGDGEGYLFAQNQHGQHTFALRIVGDSMEPEFREGDVIFVDPDVGPKAGSYVVAKNSEEEATFKKYRSRGKDAEGREVFELVPLNENYATLRSDQEPIIIIGVVVEHTRVFKV